MGTFDRTHDSPQRDIRSECIEMSIKLEKTSPTTGIISWTLPRSDCDGDMTYDGIVVTVSTTPFSKDKVPVDGTKYQYDTNINPAIFVGDKIGDSLVVFAAYGDKETTSIEIIGMDPDETYYVSGFPVDNVLRYCCDGIHGYILPYGNFEKAGPEPGRHIFEFKGNKTDATNLDPTQTYSFTVNVDGTEYTINVAGSNAQTFDDLVKEINKQLQLLSSPPLSPTIPQLNAFYLDTSNWKLYQWNGEKNVEQDSVVFPFAPNAVPSGFLWFDSSQNTLNSWNGTTWNQQQYFHFDHDPLNRQDGDFWVELGSNAGYIWNGSIWKSLTLLVQENDPSDPPNVDPAQVWYNENDQIVYTWNATRWEQVSDIILYDSDPNTLTPGSYWFSLTDNQLHQWDGTTWNQITSAIISNSDPSPVSPGTLWFNTDTEELMEWTGSSWQQISVVVHYHDPLQRQEGEYWWNTSNDTMFIWDQLNNQWVFVPFIISSSDPSNPPLYDENTLWYKPSENTLMHFWQQTEWKRVENFIIKPSGDVQVNDFWYNYSTGEWKQYDGSTWNQVSVYNSDLDITQLPAGYFWIDSTGPAVYSWSGINWIAISFVTTDPTPNEGDEYYNTTENRLYRWDGKQWVVSRGIARAFWDESENLRFETGNLVGGEGYIIVDTQGLFNTLRNYFTPGHPIESVDGVPALPSNLEQGVSDDCSADEIRKLIDLIRERLGYPVVNVELTKQQINDAIMVAIDRFRALSSSAYKRSYYALYTHKGIQVYRLTNKKQGLDKIAFVIKVARSRTAFFVGRSNYTPFEQAFIQTLYKEGAIDFTSLYLYSEYIETLSKLFAYEMQFTWDEHERILHLHQPPGEGEFLLLECAKEKTIQELLTDRLAKPWIEEYALAQAKLILGQIRSKYATLPGAGGGTTLNGNELITDAKDTILDLTEQLKRNMYSASEEWGVGSQFVIG